MIELITDSSSDISPELAQRLGVKVLPLTVHFGEESFRDGLDISNGEFYGRLRRAETLPTTSQVNPEVFTQEFGRALEQGKTVIGIFISSELSGTCQSALIAKDTLDSEDIFVIDSRSVALSLMLLVSEASRLREEGVSAQEIVRELLDAREKVRLYAVVDTLKYLKMGGRISAATAMVGGVLGVSPIVAVQDGKVVSAGKVRGRKAGIQWIRERAEEEEMDLSRSVVLGHTDSPQAVDMMKQALEQMLEQTPGIFYSDIGAAVGTHVGPGAVGISYFVK